VNGIPARLIIVDDESAQLQALCDTLSLEGYFTRGFGSAGNALKYNAKRAQPQIQVSGRTEQAEAA
jgi:hypothetical protein